MIRTSVMKRLRTFLKNQKKVYLTQQRFSLNFRACQFVKKMVSIIVAFVKFSILLKAVIFKNKDK